MSVETALINDLAELSADPLRFVMWAFPWGEIGTELAGEDGPESWQQDLLRKIRDGLLTAEAAVQEAIASGHGVGKSALVAWVALWSLATFEDARGVITANTETQLKTKTWAELGKWYRLFIAKHLFHLTATALYSADPAHERTWRIDMVPWSERNTEAFAGLHNQGKRVILIFDEASSIPDVIWETSEGALTDSNTQILWLVFGNPTRNTGRFRECFGRYRARWGTRQVDSREVSFTNKVQIAKWITDYGDDSDFVRVRVKGEFPRAGTMQFITSDDVDEAMTREVNSHLFDPLILGVDVARFGDDESVIYIRKGRDARTYEPIRLRGVDTMVLVRRVTDEYLKYRADAVFVDGTGVGGGVVDRLRELRVPVWDIQFGASADGVTPQDGVQCANKRAEIWVALREWLKIGAIPDSMELKAELIGPEYGFNKRGQLLLESKEDMKRRGLKSPDIADALALTFSFPVVSSRMAGGPEELRQKPVVEDYDPMKYAEVA